MLRVAQNKERREAYKKRREVIAKFLGLGHSLSEVGEIVGLPKQRVGQIIRDHKIKARIQQLNEARQQARELFIWYKVETGPR